MSPIITENHQFQSKMVFFQCFLVDSRHLCMIQFRRRYYTHLARHAAILRRRLPSPCLWRKPPCLCVISSSNDPSEGDKQQNHASPLLSPPIHVRPPTFRFFLRRIAVSTANFSSFFYVLPGEERRRHGENQDQCRDNDQRGVLQPDDQAEPPPNSPSPPNTTKYSATLSTR